MKLAKLTELLESPRLAPLKPVWRFLSENVALHTALVLGLMMLTRRPWGSTTRNSWRIFREPSSLFAVIEHNDYAIGFYLGSLVVAVLLFKRKWTDFDNGRALRWLAWPLFFLFAWYFALGPYNLYFGELWALDRVIIFALGVALWFRPGIAPLLLAACLVFMSQQRHGPVFPSWTDRRMYLDFLYVFPAWLVVHIFLRAKTQSFILAGLIVVGGAYWFPGVNKIDLGWAWVAENDLANLFMACHGSGWMAGAPQGFVDFLASAGTLLSPVFAISTLVVELAGILVLAHRRLTPWLLVAFAGLHLGILLLSGIFFWKWIAVDLLLALYLWRTRGVDLRARWWVLALGTLCIAFASYTLKPAKLGWYDTRLEQRFDYSVVGESGRVWPVERDGFWPYALTFAQTRFKDLYDVPRVVGTFGATNNLKLMRRFQAAKTPQDILNYVNRRKKPKINQKRGKRFDRFLKTWFENLQKFDGRPPLWWLPKLPPHINSGLVGEPWRGEEPLVEVRVEFVQTVYMDGVLHEVDRHRLRTIPLKKP